MAVAPTSSTVAPAPTPKKSSFIVRLFAWASQPSTRKDIGALVAAVTALYVAGHRAGLF